MPTLKKAGFYCGAGLLVASLSRPESIDKPMTEGKNPPGLFMIQRIILPFPDLNGALP
jgi:hypothetical protein